MANERGIRYIPAIDGLRAVAVIAVICITLDSSGFLVVSWVLTSFL